MFKGVARQGMQQLSPEWQSLCSSATLQYTHGLDCADPSPSVGRKYCRAIVTPQNPLRVHSHHVVGAMGGGLQPGQLHRTHEEAAGAASGAGRVRSLLLLRMIQVCVSAKEDEGGAGTVCSVQWRARQ